MNRYAVTYIKSSYVLSDCCHHSGALVSHNHWKMNSKGVVFDIV